MKVVLGSDERTPLTDFVVEELRARDHEVVLIGPPGGVPMEWAQVGRELGETVARGDAEMGVLFCWTGTGASIAANKVPGVRACLCHDSFSAHQGVEDDDMNLLCLGARIVGEELAVELLRTFLAARFSGAVRHQRRVGKIRRMEETKGTSAGP
jgi:ribose 5-phosphate isomerase B